MRSFLFCILFAVSPLALTAQLIECRSCGNMTIGGDGIAYYEIPNDALSKSKCLNSAMLYYELEDGSWERAPLSKSYNDRYWNTKISGITNKNFNYVAYYQICESGNDFITFPSQEEIRLKFGRPKKTYYWGYCVAEDKVSGLIFISQPFKYDIMIQEAPVAGNEGPIIREFKRHFQNILKDNPELKIRFDNVDFWFDNYCRMYRKAMGDGRHVGMDYNEITNCPSGHTRTQEQSTDNRKRLIEFKKNYRLNLDLVYDVDFDYNKIIGR